MVKTEGAEGKGVRLKRSSGWFSPEESWRADAVPCRTDLVIPLKTWGQRETSPSLETATEKLLFVQ